MMDGIVGWLINIVYKKINVDEPTEVNVQITQTKKQNLFSFTKNYL